MSTEHKLIEPSKFIFFLIIFCATSVAHAGNWNSGNSSDPSSTTNIKLNCETTNYAISGYSEEWGKSWVPEKHSVVISGGVIKSINKGAIGRVTRDTQERIEFVFDKAKDTRADGAVLKAVYFRASGKFMAKIQPSGGYAASGPIWGVCEEVRIASGDTVSQTPSANASATTATPIPSSSKIDKAKSMCEDIGFTAGTEKFGECVLKMMDN